jgi:hypothetical protein
MSDRLLARSEEARLLKAGRRALLQGEFPNPDRSGCPDKETLRSIATRKLSLEQVVEWVDHIGFCSPCYAEYDALRRQAVSRRWMQFGAIAAGIAIVVALGIWAWFGGWRQHPVGRGGEVAHREAGAYQVCRLDLRNRFVLRGGGQESPKPPIAPLELSTGLLDLTLDLPTGSREGQYEVQVLEQPGKPIASIRGAAKLENDITVIRAKIDLRNVTPGRYLLGIRRPELVWTYYPVLLK